MIRVFLSALLLTFKHLLRAFHRRKAISVVDTDYFSQVQNKLITLRYPHEKLYVPEVGRYKLHLFLEDCIGCDKCARVCPVDCIKITKVRTVDNLPAAHNGKPVKFYFPDFSIDLAKCCYCGLCTVVCPTDCLVMEPVYQHVTSNRAEFILRYSNISSEEALQKEAEWKAQRKKKRTLRKK